MMSFKVLRILRESKEQKLKAAEGFAERLAEYEKRFKAESDALEPRAEWYDRMYGVRRADHINAE